jgi:hypothetical protein
MILTAKKAFRAKKATFMFSFVMSMTVMTMFMQISTFVMITRTILPMVRTS